MISAGCAAFVLNSAVTVSPAAGSECASYTEARIFVMSWELETRRRLNPEDVRRMADCMTRITDPDQIRLFCESLRLPACSAGESRPEDARLVIDFTTADGQIRTWYASPFHLLSGNSQCRRKIDAAFRDRLNCDTGAALGG
jgi:hypothetical protein